MNGAYDAIVLLGYALHDDQPTEELKRRVHAAAEAHAQGLSGIIVVSGGAAPGSSVTEAGVMARLLEEAGVPREAILLEEQAQDTMENLRFTARLLGGAKGKRILVVTSDYHLRRSLMTARRVGFRAEGRAAALEHDADWQKKRHQELAYTLDLLMGWQDEGRSRPAWTYALFDAVFGRRKDG